MYYAIYCLDSENGAAARQQSREAHMAYLKDEPVKFLTAGPLMDKAGGGMVGSLFIIEADSYDEAKAFSDNDPFTNAGVFESIAIHPYEKRI